MSLVNFRVKPDSVLIAVDSIGGILRNKMHVNKLFPIPSSNMVVCGRGSMAFTAKVAYLCGMFSGLDEALKVLPNELPKLLRYVRIESFLLGQFRNRSVFGAQEIYLFGWSEAQGEMAALRFQKNIGSRKFTVDDDLEEGVAPALKREFPILSSTEVMMRVAVEQVQKTLQESPGAPIGGRLVVAELTQNSCKVHCAGNIEIDHMHLYRKASASK